MMKIVGQGPKLSSDAAWTLADRRDHCRVAPDKKKYSRKGRNSSMRKFEDSIQLANGRGLIEIRVQGGTNECFEGWLGDHRGGGRPLDRRWRLQCVFR